MLFAHYNAITEHRLETVNDVTVGQCLIVYFNSWEYQNWLNKTASNGIPAEMSSKCNVGCVDGSACQEFCPSTCPGMDR